MPRLSVNLEPKGAVGPLLDSGECHDPEVSCQAQVLPHQGKSSCSASTVIGGLTRPGSPMPRPNQARAAAKQLRLNVIEVANGTAADLDRQAPGWPNPCGWPSDGPAGPGRPVREGRRHHQSAAVKPGRNQGDPIVTDLPAVLGTRSSPATSSFPRKSGRRLVRSDCRWPNRRQGHPPVPRLPRLPKVHRAGDGCRPGHPAAS